MHFESAALAMRAIRAAKLGGTCLASPDYKNSRGGWVVLTMRHEPLSIAQRERLEVVAETLAPHLTSHAPVARPSARVKSPVNRPTKGVQRVTTSPVKGGAVERCRVLRARFSGDRVAYLEATAAEGINPGTAKTQWSRLGKKS